MRLKLIALIALFYPTLPNLRADEREITNAEGIFLVKYGEQKENPSRLVLAIWRDGWAVRDSTPREDTPNYSYVQLKKETIEKLIDQFINIFVGYIFRF